jgi:hypothetical protein
MTIPEIRAELLQFGITLGGPVGDRIVWLAEETRRRKPKHRAPPRFEPVVSRSQLADFYRHHPDASQVDAAFYFGVNQRAISIALNGKRR